MSNADKIKPVAFEWSEPEQIQGFTAQSIDTISIDLSEAISIDSQFANSMSVTTINSIGTSVGSNGTWVTGASGISFTDPYEEMEKRLKRLEDIIAEEQRIRDECPAVRNAYDEYRFLLVLAKRNNGDLLTDNS